MCRMTDELIIVLLRRDFCARCVTWESYFSTVLVVGTRFGIVVDSIIGTLLRLLLITLFSPHVLYCTVDVLLYCVCQGNIGFRAYATKSRKIVSILYPCNFQNAIVS